MATIGKQLAEAREDHGITIDDAAHDTRIHPNMILSIEDDDFSMFPSVAYARSFIRNYSEYLEVDLSREMEALDRSVTGRLSENELMNEMKKTIKKESRFRLNRNPGKQKRRPVEKAGGSPLFLNFLLLLLIGALGLFYILGYKASTPEEARIEITKGLNRVNIFSDGRTVAEEAAIPANPLGKPEVENVENVSAEPGETVAATPPAEPSAEPVADNPEPPSVASTDESVITKPNIEIDLEEVPDPVEATARNSNTFAMSRLRPRGTAELNFNNGEAETPSIRSEDMPAVLRTVPEPEAVLRPEGTSPASPSKADEEARRGSVRLDTPALRALPVRR